MKILVMLIGMLVCSIAFAGFLPDEVPLPANPNTSHISSDDNAVGVAPSPNVWQILIASTPKTVEGQVSILRKGGLPASAKIQGDQAWVVVGPELDKSKLQQEQKIVLELLNTPGTIVPYEIMS